MKRVLMKTLAMLLTVGLLLNAAPLQEVMSYTGSGFNDSMPGSPPPDDGLTDLGGVYEVDWLTPGLDSLPDGGLSTNESCDQLKISYPSSTRASDLSLRKTGAQGERCSFPDSPQIYPASEKIFVMSFSLCGIDCPFWRAQVVLG